MTPKSRSILNYDYSPTPSLTCRLLHGGAEKNSRHVQFIFRASEQIVEWSEQIAQGIFLLRNDLFRIRDSCASQPLLQVGHPLGFRADAAHRQTNVLDFLLIDSY